MKHTLTKTAKPEAEPFKTVEEPAKPEAPKAEPVIVQEEKQPENTTVYRNKAYEDMSVEELQEAILEKMRRNGPVTDYMMGTVRDNTHHGSLVTWVKSFN